MKQWRLAPGITEENKQTARHRPLHAANIIHRNVKFIKIVLVSKNFGLQRLVLYTFFFYNLMSKFLKINIFVLEAHKTHI